MKTISYDVNWTGKGYSGASWSARYPEPTLKEARERKRGLIDKAGGKVEIYRVKTIITKIE